MTDQRRGPRAWPDPADEDPGYWHRFQLRVLDAAAGELARRRAGAASTVSEVVLGWGRAVIPAALAAALLAGLLLVQAAPETRAGPALSDVEELLAGDLNDDPIPVVLASEGSAPGAAAEDF